MKERPILMSAPMVRAILAGTKTQTRRLVKPQPTKLAGPNFDGLWSETIDPVVRYFGCPYGAVGDRLWVKETWKPAYTDGSGTSYWADPAHTPPEERGPWKPSIFMTRARSRITLEVTDVRVERLQDISEADAIAEGIERIPSVGIMRAFGWKDYLGGRGFLDPRKSYRSLWESINGAGSWDVNPWVWPITFKRV